MVVDIQKLQLLKFESKELLSIFVLYAEILEHFIYVKGKIESFNLIIDFANFSWMSLPTAKIKQALSVL